MILGTPISPLSKMAWVYPWNLHKNTEHIPVPCFDSHSRDVCVALFDSTDIGESLCTVLGLHRERAKGDAPTIRDRRRPNLTLSPLR